MNDPRQAIYNDLHKGQLAQQEEQNRHSANVILDIVNEYIHPNSVLDVGCGLGTWLDVAKNKWGCETVGVEGQWAEDREGLVKVDLEKGFDIGKKFDLAICLEVGEHLPAACAARLVQSLTKHSDVILFSAAIPYQGGHGHVNEQFLPYWEELFRACGYQGIDMIRGIVWDDQSVLWWLRQNTVVFAKPGALEVLAFDRLLSLVHPDVYSSRIRQMEGMLQQRAQFMAQVQQGGLFRFTPTLQGIQVESIQELR